MASFAAPLFYLPAFVTIVTVDVHFWHTLLTISILALLNAHCAFDGCRWRGHAITRFIQGLVCNDMA